MVYRNKTYICFDADIDMRYYNLLKAWCANDNIEFNFYNAHEINNIMSYSSEETIKRRLRERMQNSKLLIVLIGEKTKNLFKYVRWEIELAQKMDIPIIAVNLNGINGIDNKFCPPILKNKPVVHVPFKKECIVYAMNNWINYYPTAKQKGEVNLRYRSFDYVK